MSAKKLSLKLFDGYYMPISFYSYQNFREAVDYEPKDNDVFVVSYPKSGTTWTEYIVWEILTDADEPPFVNEMWHMTEMAMVGTKKLLEQQNRLSHRLIKSHFPFQYMPFNTKGKYIYIARNPFEVCLSYFKDVSRSPNVFGSIQFDEWVRLFVNGYTVWGDYFQHVTSWFKRRHEPNVLFITYEELKNNHKEYVLRIAQFIGKEFRQRLEDSEELLNKILYYTDFEYMKTIPFIISTSQEVTQKSMGWDAKKNLQLVNHGYKLHTFFNVGKVGYSYEEFTESQIKLITDKARHQFSAIPQILDIWRSFGIKI